MKRTNHFETTENRSLTIMTKSLAAAALLVASFGIGAAFAQSGQAPAPNAPMHQGMDHRGMMDMSKMKSMMDNCNRMMEGMQQHSPAGAAATPDKG
jgi:hypothetical protein